MAATAAIQTIAELINHWDDLLKQLTRERADNARLHIEIARLNGQTRSESEQVTKLRAELTIVTQARDEWEQRAVQAEINVKTMEAELRNRDDAPAAPSLGYCCSDSGLLDIALAVLREEPVSAGDLATLIDAARRAA